MKILPRCAQTDGPALSTDARGSPGPRGSLQAAGLKRRSASGGIGKAPVAQMTRGLRGHIDQQTL